MNTNNFSAIDVFYSFSYALDLINPVLAEHHQRTAVLALKIGSAVPGFNAKQLENLVLASLIHDSGALNLSDRKEALNFEFDKPFTHSFLSAKIIERFNKQTDLSNIILFHHQRWNNSEGIYFEDIKVPEESHILHLTDRIAILTDKEEPAILQKEKIRNTITDFRSRFFKPELCDIFLDISEKDMFWLESFSTDPYQFLKTNLPDLKIDIEELKQWFMIFSEIIDSRSPATIGHTRIVRAFTEKCTELLNLSNTQKQNLDIASLCHDFGILAVPVELLNKDSKFDEKEEKLFHSHPYYTELIVNRIDGLKEIAEIASTHHEKTDGTGYPFGYDYRDLCTEQRVLSICDLLVVLLEKRKYKNVLRTNDVIILLEKLAKSGKLDSSITELIKNNYSKFVEIFEFIKSEETVQYKILQNEMQEFNRREKMNN